jgi:hypothetical protein
MPPLTVTLLPLAGESLLMLELDPLALMPELDSLGLPDVGLSPAFFRTGLSAVRLEGASVLAGAAGVSVSAVAAAVQVGLASIMASVAEKDRAARILLSPLGHASPAPWLPSPGGLLASTSAVLVPAGAVGGRTSTSERKRVSRSVSGPSWPPAAFGGIVMASGWGMIGSRGLQGKGRNGGGQFTAQ